MQHEPMEIQLTKEQEKAVRASGVSVADFQSGVIDPVLMDMARRPVSYFESARRALPKSEALVLKALGANVDYPAEDTHQAFSRGAMWLRFEWQKLLHDSWTRQQVASFLGISLPRVSQMQKQHTLYSFVHESKNYFPPFQFTEDGIVPELSRVIARLRKDAHPVLVNEFFTTPSPDLLIG
jgi:hypothetical protein